MQYKNFLKSRYPIFVPAMQGCSNIELMVACYKAGCVVSIPYDFSNPDAYPDTIKEMKRIATDRCWSMTLFQKDFHRPEVLSALSNNRPMYIEYWPRIDPNNIQPSQEWLQKGGAGTWEIENDLYVRSVLEELRKDCKIIMRYLSPEPCAYDHLIDAFELKSIDSAGRFGFYNNFQLLDLFRYRNKPMLPQGGIGTPQQVKDLLDAGAAGVGIGTMFAAAKESCMSEKTREKLYTSRKEDLYDLEDTRQKALLMSNKIEDYSPEKWNRQTSLLEGIRSGQDGLVYLGNAIDYITEDKSVDEIVGYLTSML